MERASGAAVSQLPCSPYIGAAPSGAFLPPPFLPGAPVPAALRNPDDRPIRGNPSGQYNLNFFDSVNEYEHMSRRLPARGIRQRAEWVAPPAHDANSATATFRLDTGVRVGGGSGGAGGEAGDGAQRADLSSSSAAALYRDFLVRLTSSSSNGLSSEGFAREFPYEELLLLDECVPATHRGLKPSEMHNLLVRAQGRLRSLLVTAPPADGDDVVVDGCRSAARPPCSICLLPLSSAPSPSCSRERSAYRHTESDNNSSSGVRAVTEDCCVVVLPCFHEFHRGCIQQWLTTATTCPVCRDDVRTEHVPE